MDFGKYQPEHPRNCESCEFYDCDEDGDYRCSLSLDEDEMLDFIAGQTRECHYYRYYDEYKSVQHQN